MARSVEQVQSIALAGFARVTHRHWMRLDCDSPLPFQVHGIKKLILLFPLMDRARALKQPIRQRRFAVIDVRDDEEVTRELNCYKSATMRVRSYRVYCILSCHSMRT